MQHLEVSGAVRPILGSLGVKGLNWQRNVSNQFRGSNSEHSPTCLCLQTSACIVLELSTAVRNAINGVPHTICG